MLSADKELYKDKIEVSLDSRQIFYLFFGGAVIASMVFILGVMVGKRVEARAHVGQHSSAAVTRDPLAALDQLGNGKVRLLFPSALGDPNAADQPLGKVDRAWRQKRDKAAAAKRDREHKLTGASDGAENLGAGPPTPPKGKSAADKNQHAAKKNLGAKHRSNKDKSAKAGKNNSDRSKRKLPKYTLQLSSFQQRAEAKAFFQKLTDAGYTPYIVEANVKGKGVWYRVRLGSFMAYNEALRAKKNFEAGQNVIAYVTRLKRNKR